MRKKAKKAFFEAFRCSEDSTKARAWWMPNESVGAKKGKDASSARRSGSRKYDMTAPPGRVALTFSREALVVMIVVGTTLLVISHVWAYKRGLARTGRTSAPVIVQGTQIESPGLENDSRLLSIGVNSGLRPPFHTVRVYSGIKLNSAKKIRSDLLDKGYDAFVYKEPRQRDYTLNVGRFRSRRELQDSRLQLRLATVYEDCYPVEVTSEEQIIP